MPGFCATAIIDDSARRRNSLDLLVPSGDVLVGVIRQHRGRDGANIGTVERKYQQIAADRDCASAEHDDPIDELLATVETVCRRTVTSDDTSAALEPFDVDPVRDVAGDPHEEDQDDAERE